MPSKSALQVTGQDEPVHRTYTDDTRIEEMRLIAAVGIEMGTRQAFEIAESILQMLQTKHSGKARRDAGTCGGKMAHNEFESCRGSRRACFWTGLRLYFRGREVDS